MTESEFYRNEWENMNHIKNNICMQRGGGGRGKRKGGGKRKWNNSQGGSTPKRRSVEGLYIAHIYNKPGTRGQASNRIQ